MDSLTVSPFSTFTFFYRQLALMVSFCLSLNSFFTYFTESEVLPTLPRLCDCYLSLRLLFCRLESCQKVIYYTTQAILDKYIIMRIDLFEKEQKSKAHMTEMERTEVDSSFEQINRQVIQRAQSILRNIRVPSERVRSSNYHKENHNYASLGDDRTHHITHSSRKSYDVEKDEIDFLSLESIAKRRKGNKHQFRRHSQGIIIRADKDDGIDKFNKITMHCLRSDRNKIIKQTQRLDTNLSFVKQKLQKRIIYKKTQLKNSRRLKTLHQNTRKQKQQMLKIQHEQQMRQRERIEKLRKSIFCHRDNREKALRQNQMVKAIQCHVQRLEKASLKKKREQKYDIDLKERKKMYQQQKERSQSFHLRKKRALSYIKQQAKRNFHNKWLQQYSLTAKAKQNFNEKQEIYYKKMSKVIQRLSDQSSSLYI